MNGFVATLVGLPPELKAAIALAVLALVRLALSGRVPDAWATELAGVITTAVVAVFELALGLIPARFEAIAAAILQLIVVLLGAVVAVRVYLLARSHSQARGIRF